MQQEIICYILIVWLWYSDIHISIFVIAIANCTTCILTESYWATLFNINHNTVALNAVAISLHALIAMVFTMMIDS